MSEPSGFLYQAGGVAIRVPSTVHKFPPFSDIVDKDPFEEPIFAETPWFHLEFFTNEALIDQYMLGGVLPGGIPREAVFTEDWRRHCAMNHRDIRSRFGQTEEQSRWRFIRLVYQRVRRTIGMTYVPQSLRFDTWIVRAEGEAHGYLYPLSILDFSAWRNRLDVDHSSFCWEQPILRFQFRCICKYDPVRSSVTEFVGFERRPRSHTGYLVPYQTIEIDSVSVRPRDSG